MMSHFKSHIIPSSMFVLIHIRRRSFIQINRSHISVGKYIPYLLPVQERFRFRLVSLRSRGSAANGFTVLYVARFIFIVIKSSSWWNKQKQQKAAKKQQKSKKKQKKRNCWFCWLPCFANSQVDCCVFVLDSLSNACCWK